MPEPLASKYNPHDVEDRLYRFWEEGRFFHSEPDPSRKPYTIVIPPPNVTGALHMGHALNNALQDVLIRWRRMQGYNALWMPGTDHAGIATQNVVEKELAVEGKNREQLGREKFLE
ncbi:MAG: class I tRNA ligase family protein, partial [Planctomycetes bacterium]|nr:class I tRNA ligase family protein [Planctomycetota bacterium]